MGIRQRHSHVDQVDANTLIARLTRLTNEGKLTWKGDILELETDCAGSRLQVAWGPMGWKLKIKEGGEWLKVGGRRRALQALGKAVETHTHGDGRTNRALTQLEQSLQRLDA